MNLRVPVPLRAVCTALSLLVASVANASTVHDLRDWLEGLNGVYGVQQADSEWTFHNADHTGSLFVGDGVSSFRGPTSPQSIGFLVNPGDLGCTAGFCPGSVPADTRATFAGTFVHTGATAATAAVFRADAAMLLEEIELTTEMVQNAHNGNGMDVFVRVYTGGVAHDLGQFTVTYANTTTSALHNLYTPGLTLAAGDVVEVLYDPRGSYLYDHSNVDIRIVTSAADAPPAGVPEPASLTLVGLGLVAAFRPRRRALA